MQSQLSIWVIFVGFVLVGSCSFRKIGNYLSSAVAALEFLLESSCISYLGDGNYGDAAKDSHFLLQNARTPEEVSEGFLKGPRTCQPKDPSKPLAERLQEPSKTFQEGVEIDDALGFLGLKNQFQGPGVL